MRPAGLIRLRSLGPDQDLVQARGASSKGPDPGHVECPPEDSHITPSFLDPSAFRQSKDADMPYPEFITAFPSIDVPFPEDVVQTAVVKSDAGLVAFFTFLKDMELPAHSHGAQWGTVVDGEIEFTIGGETKIYRAGDSYSIPAGVEHGAMIKAGTRVIDVFEEADRYAIKS
jgi:quercetin dioxygenase-like cupin family protein